MTPTYDSRDSPHIPGIVSDKVVMDRLELTAGLWPVLYPVMRELGNSLDVDETLELLDRRLRDVVGFDGIAVAVARAGRMAPLYAAGIASGPELIVMLDAAPEFSGLLELHRATAFSELERAMLIELAPKAAAALANALKWKRAQSSMLPETLRAY